MSVVEFAQPVERTRHIISLDGTWQRENQDNPTNIKILHDSFKEGLGEDGVYQRKVYHDGVATKGSWLRKAWNGVTGGDLEEIVCKAYRDICLNYNEGDELLLTGFSRGAFTARTLNGMIYNVGILKDAKNMQPEDLDKAIKKAYNEYRSEHKPNSLQARKFREEHSYATRPDVNIAAFDTVGELGIPKQFFFLNGISNWLHGFHDTNLNKNTKVALHALAIDEKRLNFDVTPMECSVDCETNLQQMYFAGNHSAVGGGSAENRGLSDIAGKWIAEQLRDLVGVGFKEGAIENNFKPNPEANPGTDFRNGKKSWIRAAWELAGFKTREIIKNAQIHWSVDERMLSEVASYTPEQLMGRKETLLAQNAAPKSMDNRLG